MVLTQAQRAHWRDDGFLVIPAFFTEQEVEAVIGALDLTWATRPHEVTVDDLATWRRLRASQVSDDERADHTFKVNDLYLSSHEVRGVALSARVGAILGELLDDVPVLCNTLNLEKGSQQADHLDTLYMTPTTPDKLVATWMALEDSHPDAGPLRYWPGSNHIDPYHFSDGGLHTVPDEMDRWTQYMADQVDRRGLEQQTFCARRGDLLIWHAWLLHGGSRIADPARTRNSLVTHYFARSDVEHFALGHEPGGEWWVRPPQPVPSDAHLSGEEAELAERAEAERAVTAVRTEAPEVPDTPERGLFDRMRGLVPDRN
jgi:hypothetical protein